MTIEVRQLVVRSQVGDDSGADEPGQAASAEDGRPAWIEEIRRELLAECREWVEDRLRRARER
jgi:hypothetical protein